jgi:hypothetical protein
MILWLRKIAFEESMPDFELRTLHFLGRCFTTWAIYIALFAIVVLMIGFTFFLS